MFRILRIYFVLVCLAQPWRRYASTLRPMRSCCQHKWLKRRRHRLRKQQRKHQPRRQQRKLRLRKLPRRHQLRKQRRRLRLRKLPRKHLLRRRPRQKPRRSKTFSTWQVLRPCQAYSLRHPQDHRSPCARPRNTFQHLSTPVLLNTSTAAHA